MKCTICDKCKKIIEKPEQVRTITCTRPMMAPAFRREEEDKTDARRYPIDKRPNDIVWQKELCMDCANAAEEFLAAEESSDTPAPASPTEDTGDSQPDPTVSTV